MTYQLDQHAPDYVNGMFPYCSETGDSYECNCKNYYYTWDAARER